MKYNYNYIFSLLRECHFENRFYANGENYKKSAAKGAFSVVNRRRSLFHKEITPFYSVR